MSLPPDTDPETTFGTALVIVAMIVLVVVMLSGCALKRVDPIGAAALTAGNTADGITTHRFLHNGSGCVESLGWLGTHPHAAKITAAVGVNVGIGLGILWLSGLLEDHPDATPGERRFAKWFGRSMGIAGGAIAAKSAIHNVRLCGF